MNEAESFNFNKYWGPDELRPFVEYTRRGIHYCIYCGAKADTREHVPSKLFLKKPLPCNLPVLPACKKCNNGFSTDELYTKTYIKCLKAFFDDHDYDCLQIKPTDPIGIMEAKKAVKEAVDLETLRFDNRVGRILAKLAIGHAVYELSEGYHSQKWNGVPISIKYLIRATVSKEEWENLEYAEMLNKNAVPVIGSRGFRNYLILQMPIETIETEKRENLNLVMMDWTDVQNGIYRYIAYFEENKLIVKMIIMDYLYGEVVFQEYQKHEYVC